MASDSQDSVSEFFCRSCNIVLSSGICPSCDSLPNFVSRSPAETLGSLSEEETNRIGEFPRWSLWDDTSPSNIEDNYEVFDRLLNNIISATTEETADPSPDTAEYGTRPAAQSYVDSIPTVEITDAVLAVDPFLICAVCKEEFTINADAKKLLCGHIYHPGCIFPWLSYRSSCPVCRFCLPTDNPLRRQYSGAELQDGQVTRDVREIHRLLMAMFPGRDMPPVEDPDTLPEMQVDFLGIDPILRRIAARHRMAFSGRNDGNSGGSDRASVAPIVDGDADIAESGTLGG